MNLLRTGTGTVKVDVLTGCCEGKMQHALPCHHRMHTHSERPACKTNMET